jgi:hypothetical protein
MKKFTGIIKLHSGREFTKTVSANGIGTAQRKIKEHAVWMFGEDALDALNENSPIETIVTHLHSE